VVDEQSLFGIFHRYGGDKVVVMRDASILDLNDRRYRFQMGRLNSPSTGSNTYQVQFGYTGAKTVLFTAVSYKGVDLSSSGMEAVESETNAEPPGLAVVSTASGNLVVDSLLYREDIPFGASGAGPTSPIASGGQLVATVSGVFTVDNYDWGLVISEKPTTASGAVNMGWVGTLHTHMHLAGSVVSS